jgi:hypothetical protein
MAVHQNEIERKGQQVQFIPHTFILAAYIYIYITL